MAQFYSIYNKKITMRKIIMICVAASVFAACNNPDKNLETKKDVVVTDTANMYKSNGSTDTATVSTATVNNVAPPAVTTTKTITRTRTVYVDRTPKRINQNNVQHAQPQQVNTVPQTQTNAGSAPATRSGNGTTNSPGTGTSTTGTTTPASKPADKGWSNASKDAVIGGVGGAVGGAIISRKKGKGAIIGGIIGATGGYILGRKKDKGKADTIK